MQFNRLRSFRSCQRFTSKELRSKRRQGAYPFQLLDPIADYHPHSRFPLRLDQKTAKRRCHFRRRCLDNRITEYSTTLRFLFRCNRRPTIYQRRNIFARYLSFFLLLFFFTAINLERDDSFFYSSPRSQTSHRTARFVVEEVEYLARTTTVI